MIQISSAPYDSAHIANIDVCAHRRLQFWLPLPSSPTESHRGFHRLVAAPNLRSPDRTVVAMWHHTRDHRQHPGSGVQRRHTASTLPSYISPESTNVTRCISGFVCVGRLVVQNQSLASKVKAVGMVRAWTLHLQPSSLASQNASAPLQQLQKEP